MLNKSKIIPAKQRIILTTVYLLCIYSTLGIARPVAEYLRTEGVLLLIVLLLFGACGPLVLFWRYKTISRKQFFLRIVLIVFLLCAAFSVEANPEERLHFLIYGLLGWP